MKAFLIVLVVASLSTRAFSAEKAPAPDWGPEVNGVRASLRVSSKPLSLYYPNEIGIFVTVENRSDESVSYVISDNGKGVGLLVKWAVFERKVDLFSRYRVKPGGTIMKPKERRVIACTMAFVKGSQLVALDKKEVRGFLQFMKASGDGKSLKKFKVKTNTVRFEFPKAGKEAE
jgi:hypothetical protein